MTASIPTYLRALERGELDIALSVLHGVSSLTQSRKRLTTLLGTAGPILGEHPVALLGAPGRTELGGNHTDHNHGHVLAAAIQLDILAVAAPTYDTIATIHSDICEQPIVVDLANTAPRPKDQATSTALVRGVADGFIQQGHAVSGFTACLSSTIPMGSGLSSSAAFEVLTGRILNHLFNADKVSSLEIARAAHRAENLHFGKPCGFMDQIACAFGGVLGIDFDDPDNPGIQRVEADFAGTGYQLCVVNTGGHHADLTPDYAAIPTEMRAAANILGRETARGLTMDDLMESIPMLRERAGDRAVLRLIHFIEEDARAIEQAEALRHKDMGSFLTLLNNSGDSSWRLLQNCFSPSEPTRQPIPLALAMSKHVLNGRGGCRVHGGGFAGTIQAFVPSGRFPAYRTFMDSTFGQGAVTPLTVRQPGHEILQVKN